MVVKKYKTPINIAGGEEKFVCPQALVLNTYLGCAHQCVYCYAGWVLDIYKKWDTVIPADVNIIEEKFVRAFKENRQDKISKLLRMRIPFRFANITDGFQEIERTEGVSYKALEILKEYKYPVIINTKGIVIGDDKYIELLKQIPVVVQMTLTTLDEDLTACLEPHAPTASERLEILYKLYKNDIITQLRYSPVFPMLTDSPEKLFAEASSVGVRDIICEFVRLPKTKKYLNILNDNLGYDYLFFLNKFGYPLISTGHWWKVEKPFIFEEYKSFKQMAEMFGLSFYICCEEQPEINNWKNCCGTQKYLGFENCMDWTVQMNGSCFGKSPIEFATYMVDFFQTCPYVEDFRTYFESGKLKTTLSDLTFDGIRYTRNQDKE